MEPDALSRRLISTAELAERSTSPTQIGRLLAHGCLRRLTQGLYACVRHCARPAHARVLVGLPVAHLRTPEQQLGARGVAVARRLGPEVALTGRAVVALHGLPVLGASEAAIELRTDRSRSRNRSGYRLFPGYPDDGHVTEGAAFGISSLSLALADTAAFSPAHSALASLDAGLARGAPAASIAAHLDAGAVSAVRRRRARRLLEFADPRAESPGESWARWLFEVHGLPAPELQARIADARGRVIARVDALWREARLVFEFDGRVKYRGDSAGDAVFEEKVREDRLRAEGYAVVRAIWADLYRFDAVADRLRACLGQSSMP